MGRNGHNCRKVIQQAAVLAMRNGRICLITSSSGRRWLLPKGHLEPGHKLRETARRGVGGGGNNRQHQCPSRREVRVSEAGTSLPRGHLLDDRDAR